ncbi:MAG: Lipopolysaccharide export system permease protein LptG, partial [uncultured Gemmatimonadaceae bacterium]
GRAARRCGRGRARERGRHPPARPLRLRRVGADLRRDRARLPAARGDHRPHRQPGQVSQPQDPLRRSRAELPVLAARLDVHDPPGRGAVRHGVHDRVAHPLLRDHRGEGLGDQLLPHDRADRRRRGGGDLPRAAHRRGGAQDQRAAAGAAARERVRQERARRQRAVQLRLRRRAGARVQGRRAGAQQGLALRDRGGAARPGGQLPDVHPHGAVGQVPARARVDAAQRRPALRSRLGAQPRGGVRLARRPAHDRAPARPHGEPAGAAGDGLPRARAVHPGDGALGERRERAARRAHAQDHHPGHLHRDLPVRGAAGHQHAARRGRLRHRRLARHHGDLPDAHPAHEGRGRQGAHLPRAGRLDAEPRLRRGGLVPHGARPDL